MMYQDDRTSEEKKSLDYLVVGTDTFLSGWGHAEGGTSYAAWACTYENLDKVESWVRGRSDMKRVRVCGNSWRPRGIGHSHIYPVRDGHNALA